VTIKVFKGDTFPSLTLCLKEYFETVDCQQAALAKDLTGYEVRGRFCKNLEKASSPCDPSRFVIPDNSIFYRVLPLQEFDLLASTPVDALGGDVTLSPTKQPAGPQVLQLEITNFAVAGDITITGKDPRLDVVTETLTISADGSLLTTKQFNSIDVDGIVIKSPGDFDVRIFVHDGKVVLDWQAGDLSELGKHTLQLELIPDPTGAPDDRLTTCETVEILVKDRKPLSKPVVSAVAPLSGPAATSLTVTGTGFLDASTAVLVSQVDGTETTLDSFAVVSETSITGDIPAVGAGDYDLVVRNADGDSDPYSKVTVT